MDDEESNYHSDTLPPEEQNQNEGERVADDAQTNQGQVQNEGIQEVVLVVTANDVAATNVAVNEAPGEVEESLAAEINGIPNKSTLETTNRIQSKFPFFLLILYLCLTLYSQFTMSCLLRTIGCIPIHIG